MKWSRSHLPVTWLQPCTELQQFNVNNTIKSKFYRKLLGFLLYLTVCPYLDIGYLEWLLEFWLIYKPLPFLYWCYDNFLKFSTTIFLTISLRAWVVTDTLQDHHLCPHHKDLQAWLMVIKSCWNLKCKLEKSISGSLLKNRPCYVYVLWPTCDANHKDHNFQNFDLSFTKMVYLF